jgi:hypothetical protein
MRDSSPAGSKIVREQLQLVADRRKALRRRLGWRGGHGVRLSDGRARPAEGGRVAEALLALERAIISTETLATVVEPLHGATERLGRIVDRLPGQRGGGQAAE